MDHYSNPNPCNHCQGCHQCNYTTILQCSSPTPPPPIARTLSFATFRVTTSPTVNDGTDVPFGGLITGHGKTIQHTADTTTFTLLGGYIYNISFSINGVVVLPTIQSGITFSLRINNFDSDTRVVSQNFNDTYPYNSGWASGYVTVPTGRSTVISIRNIGLNDVDLVNGMIDIREVAQLTK